MLDQRRRRWADVVQMLYKWFVFNGIVVFNLFYHSQLSLYWDRNVCLNIKICKCLVHNICNFHTLEAAIILSNTSLSGYVR